MQTIEFRCPTYPTTLFWKSTVEEVPPAEQQQFDVACPQCRRNLGVVGLVIHWFGADGSHLDTQVVERKRQTPAPRTAPSTGPLR
jgi:hypothetical protein